MTRTICGKVYSTEQATLIKKFTEGYWGEAEGYEITLYQIASGHYFLYMNGGDASKQPKEKIRRISSKKVELWLSEH